jgi:DNA adenine methylase
MSGSAGAAGRQLPAATRHFTPDRVHWPAYAGRNFTHRQSIKRKANSWGRRYQAMPPAERLAVLSSIMAVEAGEALE